jgi:hypothetical protein
MIVRREEQERQEGTKEAKSVEFVRKKEQMRRVKVGLSDLFKGEWNPMLDQMIPRTDERQEWIGFEGAYEVATHRI